VSDCAIIYILLITEHNGDVSPENTKPESLPVKTCPNRHNLTETLCNPVKHQMSPDNCILPHKTSNYDYAHVGCDLMQTHDHQSQVYALLE
jgi:hypothetical protein